MLRLAVWFYQVRYHVREFLEKAQREAERERNGAQRKRIENSYIDKVRAACRANVAAVLGK